MSAVSHIFLLQIWGLAKTKDSVRHSIQRVVSATSFLWQFPGNASSCFLLGAGRMKVKFWVANLVRWWGVEWLRMENAGTEFWISCFEASIMKTSWKHQKGPCLDGNFGVDAGKSAWEACNAMWNLGANIKFSLRPSRITLNSDRTGWSQDLQDT